MLCEDPNPFEEAGRQEDMIIQFSRPSWVYTACALAVCSFNDGISSLSSLAF